MARYGYEEQVCLIRILRTEPAFPDVLKEVALAGVLAGQFPRRLEVRIRIPIWVNEHLKFSLHLGVALEEDLRGVVDRGRRQSRASQIAGNFGHGHL